MNVAKMVGLLDGPQTNLVGRADDAATPNPTTGHPHRESQIVMVTTFAALRLGIGNDVPAWTVQRNCASGLQALDSAVMEIVSGRAELVLAGGVEAMSHCPVLYNEDMVTWLGALSTSKTLLQRLKVFTQIRPRYLKPVIALLRGLTDPVVGLSMGQTAENIAYRFHITREQMDSYAVRSHQRLTAAQDENLLTEIEPLYDRHGNVYANDDGLRRDSSVERLAKIRPVFDKPFGLVTAGNSAQVTDGAALLLLASEKAVKEHNLPVLGKIIDTHWAALEPAQMGLGPVHATTPILTRNNLNLDDIDFWEINEAFASQAVYCVKELGLDKHMDKVNIHGGAIALGHPLGCTGAKLCATLLNSMKERGVTITTAIIKSVARRTLKNASAPRQPVQ